MKAKFLLFSMLFSICIGCQKQTKEDNSTKDSIATVDSIKANGHNAQNSLDYIGTYKGILPCADCEGLETMIEIHENNTYTIKTKYNGKGDKIFQQRGTFSWNKQGNTIVFEGIKNAPNQYFVAENSLIQLDMEGKKITGDFAKDYILSKQNSSNIEVETTEDKNIAVDLNDRMKAQTVIKKVNPAIGKFPLAETKWKLIALNGKAVVDAKQNDFYIKLNSKDGQFSAFAGCNNFGGSYFMKSAFTLSFSKIISTMMVCPNMKFETRFSSMLSQVNSYSINNNILQFKSEKKVTLAIFEASK